MYDVFDRFLATSTWHTGHPTDLERFNQALDKVVREPDFNADQMADYIRGQVGVTDEHHPLAAAVDHLQGNGWAVREYLEATGEIP